MRRSIRPGPESRSGPSWRVSASPCWPRAPRSAQGPTLVIAQGADITTLDPTQATQIHNLNLFYNIYDALVTWDPKDIGKVVPELAVSWRSVNPTTWQFKLRQGVKFHNGEPFNAEAAKFTIDRLITKGVHQVYGGFATIERAEVVDPYTINVVTSKPDPDPGEALRRLRRPDAAAPVPEAGGLEGLRAEAGGHRAVQVRGVGEGRPRRPRGQRRLLAGRPEDQEGHVAPDPGQLRPRGRADPGRGPADHQGHPRPRRADREGRLLPRRAHPDQPHHGVPHQRPEGAAREHQGPAGAQLRRRQEQDHQGALQRVRDPDRERHPEHRLRVQSGHQALPVRSRDGEEAPRRGRLRERPRDRAPERQRHPPERQAAHRGGGGDAGRGGRHAPR